jgi:phosphoribosylanthranilate isomerase
MGEPGENFIRPLVKFCGLTRQEDALRASRLGADFAGFVMTPRSKRHICPVRARDIDTGTLGRVGVFVCEGVGDIIKAMETARLDFAQLHGPYGTGAGEAIGPERVIRAVWPEKHETRQSLEEHLSKWESFAKYFLFDAGLSEGGHGRRIDSDDLSFLSCTSKKSFLAGGLGPENVSGLWPAKEKNLCGFDFNSGVEASPGVKDWDAMEAVMENLGIKPGKRG